VGERRIAARRWVRCTDEQTADEPSHATLGDVRIVPFEGGHADAHRALVTDTLREFGFEPDPEIDPDLDDPAAVYAALWVAVSDTDVVGSVALRDLGDGALELKRMYLRPEVRGRGLGKRLLATALDHARATGAHVVRLDTSERMETARHLYEAHGFARVPGYAPRQGQQRLLYELRL
jgi:GNAT superfamily N-acetyltransferase